MQLYMSKSYPGIYIFVMSHSQLIENTISIYHINHFLEATESIIIIVMVSTRVLQAKTAKLVINDLKSNLVIGYHWGLKLVTYPFRIPDSHLRSNLVKLATPTLNNYCYINNSDFVWWRGYFLLPVNLYLHACHPVLA